MHIGGWDLFNAEKEMNLDGGRGGTWLDTNMRKYKQCWILYFEMLQNSQVESLKGLSHKI